MTADYRAGPTKDLEITGEIKGGLKYQHPVVSAYHTPLNEAALVRQHNPKSYQSFKQYKPLSVAPNGIQTPEPGDIDMKGRDRPMLNTKRH